MAQRWYQKATVQAAIAGGMFVLCAAAVVPVLDRMFPKKSELDIEKSLTALDAKFQEALTKIGDTKGEKEKNEALASALTNAFSYIDTLCVNDVKNADYADWTKQQIVDDIRNIKDCEDQMRSIIIEAFLENAKKQE